MYILKFIYLQDISHTTHVFYNLYVMHHHVIFYIINYLLSPNKEPDFSGNAYTLDLAFVLENVIKEEVGCQVLFQKSDPSMMSLSQSWRLVRGN